VAQGEAPVLAAQSASTEDSRPRAVLDSSVLVSRWSRLVLQRLASASPPLFEPLWSEWIIAETWRVLPWRACKAGASEVEVSQKANQMLQHLLPVMHPVALQRYEGPPPWPSLADPDDEPIWATAVVGEARFVVSDNTTDFPPFVRVGNETESCRLKVPIVV
jgi:PIN domain